MDSDLTLRLTRVRPETDEDIPLPAYMTPQSAGMDIHAAVETELIIQPGEIRLIPTGFAVAVPNGFEAQIRPRSGLAVKKGITLINAPGTVDADYRGEVQVALINLGQTPFTIRRNDRIAQMVINRIYQPRLELVKLLDETDRNAGGFGHTGV